jgi:tetratricopeptide (TPR) repeat protein
MITPQTFSQYLVKHPIEQEELMKEIDQLYSLYPASSTLGFLLLKLLKNNAPALYELRKSKLLLSVINKERFRKKKFQTGTIIPPLKTDTQKIDLIDHLIEEFSDDPPKIKFNPEKHDSSFNYGKASLIEDKYLISETLAIIYAKQGHINKAIKIYKKLALLFPKKNCYFATQIKELKDRKDIN